MQSRAPLTAAEQERIVQHKGEGASLGEIAQELDCSVETIRKWWRKKRKGETVRQRGRPLRGILSSYAEKVVEQAITLKKSHPHWGPAQVKVELQEQYGELVREDLPSDARLSALFKARCPEAVQPRSPRTYPEETFGGADWPHQRWQMDGKEAIRLQDGNYVTVLEIRDPYSALILVSRAFITTTEKGWRKLTLAEVQETLRLAFARWGKPLQIQTDRETVYVGSPEANFPSCFTLWLVGMGITHLLSRSHRPTDQPHIERNHRTMGDWVWKDQTFETLALLQQALDHRCASHNQHYPTQAAHCHGQPPLVVFPWATHSQRLYHPAIESDGFSMERVDQYLAQRVHVRQANANCVVSLGGHSYTMGQPFRDQPVTAQFLPALRSFRFRSAEGHLIRDLPALGLDITDILGPLPPEVLPFLFQLPLPLVGV